MARQGGSVLENISLEDASAMALRTAMATPTRRRWILPRKMAFDVLSAQEDENSYTIVISFRPVGNFEGAPGQERFRFSKTGRFEDREVLGHPKNSKKFRIKRRTIAFVLIGIIILIGLGLLGVVLERGSNCPNIGCQKDRTFTHTDYFTNSMFNTELDVTNGVDPNFTRLIARASVGLSTR